MLESGDEKRGVQDWIENLNAGFANEELKWGERDADGL